jgi:hypothetical protein
MELPTITKSAYASSAVDHMAILGFGGGLERRIQPAPQNVAQAIGMGIANQLLIQEQNTVSTARIVKVFIADPNDNLPLDKRVLYKGEEMLTDLTDQELFYEVPIADLLAKHNEYRKTVVDKKQAEKFGRDIFMEAARIRDLRMVVVDVAKF